MFYSILRSFLGPFSVVLDFFASRTEWITAFFCIYLGMYAIAKIQITGIKKMTLKLIQDQCPPWLKAHPDANDDQLYSFFLPIWETELKQTGYKFILNKYDFWPVAATPQNVLLKIHLSSRDLKRYMEGQKISDVQSRERIIAAHTRKK